MARCAAAVALVLLPGSLATKGSLRIPPYGASLEHAAKVNNTNHVKMFYGLEAVRADGTDCRMTINSLWGNERYTRP